MTTLRLVAAGNPTKSPDGALGLLVFLALAVVVYFLFRSMNKHLRKVARAVEPLLSKDVPVLLCSKGIETGSGKLMTAVVADEMPGRP